MSGLLGHYARDKLNSGHALLLSLPPRVLQLGHLVLRPQVSESVLEGKRKGLAERSFCEPLKEREIAWVMR